MMVTPATKKFWIIWYSIWIIITIGFVLLTAITFFQNQAFLSRAELDTGTITSYELYVRNDGKAEYCPLIKLTSKAGDPLSIRGEDKDCPNAPDNSQIGKQVQVYFDPGTLQHPDLREASFFQVSLISNLVVTVVASLFWLIPLVISIVRKSRKATQASPVLSTWAGKDKKGNR